jgi:hypothetical protein
MPKRVDPIHDNRSTTKELFEQAKLTSERLEETSRQLRVDIARLKVIQERLEKLNGLG